MLITLPDSVSYQLQAVESFFAGTEKWPLEARARNPFADFQFRQTKEGVWRPSGLSPKHYKVFF